MRDSIQEQRYKHEFAKEYNNKFDPTHRYISNYNNTVNYFKEQTRKHVNKEMLEEYHNKQNVTPT